jgi:hypothetical protein
MKTYSFKVVVEPDEDAQGDPAWYAYCPALESVGGATSGRNREEVGQPKLREERLLACAAQ